MQKRTLILRKCGRCLIEVLVRKDAAGEFCRSCRAKENHKLAKYKDIVGLTFGRLKVQKVSHKVRQFYWVCLCECGNSSIVSGNKLRSGKTKSCGCLTKTQKGLSQSPTYRSWRAMIQRCYDKNVPHYRYYGAKGVEVCERWLHSFENFALDLGERPIRKTLDRINPMGNYEPNNCRWLTSKEQYKNQRKDHYAKVESKCS